MSLPSKKNDGAIGDLDTFNKRLPVNVLDDSQWLFIRKRFRMSPRELDIAKMVCGGLINEDISKRLGIKTATIKTHLRNIYRRIRVQRKLDMLLMFLDQSAKYVNSGADATVAVAKGKSAGKEAGTEISGANQITSH